MKNLNTIVWQNSATINLYPGFGEDQFLFILGDAYFDLDQSLEFLYGVILIHILKNDSSRESLDKDFHSFWLDYQMNSGFFLNFVVIECEIRENCSVLKHLTVKYKPLLFWRNTFLVLDLSLDVFDGFSMLNF